MNAVFKRDFRSYFTSPLGYVYVGAFILLMNLVFYFLNLSTGGASLSGTYSYMLFVLMVTTPILTMRSFSEDLRQKTDQLLFTSPVKPWSVVLAKFLAPLAVFALVLVLTLLWPLVISIYGTVNTAEVIGNLAALLSVAGVYIAMGVFISSLTENQLIAALGSLGLFVLLYLMDFAASLLSMSTPGWVLRTLQFLSVFSRYESIRRGLFPLSDLIFFLTFAGLFLFLTTRTLEKKRWS